jgi:hypothetical protein
MSWKPVDSPAQVRKEADFAYVSRCEVCRLDQASSQILLKNEQRRLTRLWMQTNFGVRGCD